MIVTDKAAKTLMGFLNGWDEQTWHEAGWEWIFDHANACALDRRRWS